MGSEPTRFGHADDVETIPMGAGVGSAEMTPHPGGEAMFQPDRPPERIGPFRITGVIGEGGMGSVLLGLRDDGRFRQRVAIKLIRRGMDSEEVLKRFELERQLLASLNHPNIARLFQGGMTEDGRPYFVLEHIEGQTIDEHCESHNLTVEERLNLFRTVCLAVHHAHQNLVVHRDIKPSNILVTKEGVPKLLDFGIAKLLNPEFSPVDMIVTRADARLMTPEYASPEQIRGEPVTTASDVYSLGVLLYELLTGRRPYYFQSRAPAEIERVVSQVHPERPSTAVTRVTRLSTVITDPMAPIETGTHRAPSDGSPARLRKRISGDIDNIVMMAMRKEPNRRYASAEQLGEDIRRHLTHLPVIARPESAWYVTSKFVRRNRVGVAAAILLLVSLIGGVAATAWQANVAAEERDIAAQERDKASAERDRAERRFGQVRALANTFMFEFHDAIKDLPGATPARELLVTNALQYLDSLAVEASDDPGLMSELAHAFERVGDVQGGLRSSNVGDARGALASYERALEIRKRLAEVRPDDTAVQRLLADSHMRVGDMRKELGDARGALDAYEEALALHRALVREAPGDLHVRRDLAVGLLSAGDGLVRIGDLTGGLDRYTESLELRRSLVRENPTDMDALRDLSVAHIRVGFTSKRLGDAAAATDHFERALALREEIAAGDPKSLGAQRDIMVARMYVGDALKDAGDTAGAIDMYSRQREVAHALFEADPVDARARRDLVLADKKVGDALVIAGRLDEALVRFGASLALAELWSAESPDNPRAMAQLADAHSQIGKVQVLKNDNQSGLESHRRALDLYTQVVAKDPLNPLAQRSLAMAHRSVGDALHAMGDHDGAVAALRASVRLHEELAAEESPSGPQRSDLAAARERLADVLLARGDRAMAAAALRAAEEDYGRLGADNPDDAGAREGLERVRGRLAEVADLGT